MSDDQYNKLFKYMHGEFAKLNTELAKKADAEDLRALDAKIDGVEARLTKRIDQVDRKVDQRADEILGQLNVVQDAVGETFNTHETWITQLASVTGTTLKGQPE